MTPFLAAPASDVPVWGQGTAAVAAANRSSGVTMPDKATSRVVAVIALLIVVAAALRGYLPGNDRTPREHATNAPASLAFIVTLLGVSLAIILVAIVTRLREPRAVARAPGGLPEALGGKTGRLSWRVLLIGLGLIAAWLLTVLLLTRLVHHSFGGQVPPPGSTAAAPSAKATVPPPPGQQTASPDNGGNVLGYLGTSTVTLLVLLITATLVASRRRRDTATTVVAADDDGEPSAPPVASEFLVRAAERGLAEIEDLSREPREAIIACYAAMERELAHIPGSAPQAFDTPTEVLERAVEHHALHGDDAAQLVNLFAEARFSPHVMSERHREVAVTALQLVLAELKPQATGRLGSHA